MDVLGHHSVHHKGASQLLEIWVFSRLSPLQEHLHFLQLGELLLPSVLHKRPPLVTGARTFLRAGLHLIFLSASTPSAQPIPGTKRAGNQA